MNTSSSNKRNMDTETRELTSYKRKLNDCGARMNTIHINNQTSRSLANHIVKNCNITFEELVRIEGYLDLSIAINAYRQRTQSKFTVEQAFEAFPKGDLFNHILPHVSWSEYDLINKPCAFVQHFIPEKVCDECRNDNRNIRQLYVELEMGRITSSRRSFLMQRIGMLYLSMEYRHARRDYRFFDPVIYFQ